LTPSRRSSARRIKPRRQRAVGARGEIDRPSCVPSAVSPTCAVRRHVLERGGEVDLEERRGKRRPERARIEPRAEQEDLGRVSVGGDERLDGLVDVARAQLDHPLEWLVGACRGDGGIIDEQPGEGVGDEAVGLEPRSPACARDQRCAGWSAASMVTFLTVVRRL
jgi:hypothetical protein